jgi:hypothetical protein
VALLLFVSCCRDLTLLRPQISDEAMQANTAANVSNRGVSGEPMYMLFNLGMSESE